MTEQIGTAVTQPAGLYTIVTATLPQTQGLMRLWLVGKAGLTLLGTPIPVGGALQCRKKLSRHQMPAELMGVVSLRDEAGKWMRGADLLYRTDGPSLQIAARYQEGEPLAWLANYLQLRTAEIEGHLYLVKQILWRDWFAERNKPGTG